MRFEIPGEPVSMNNAYFTPRNSRRRVLSSEGKAFKAHVSHHVTQARLSLPAGRLHLTLHFYGSWDTKTGEPRKKDLSNAIKLCEDAICEALRMDDKWIRRLDISATHDALNPRIVAEITALGGE